MSMPILKTRLFIPPVWPNHVRRPRLDERLQAGVGPGRRLTLVSAPPGSGKTTLLAGWAAQSRQPLAWLTLDAELNDPAQFRAHLLAALQTVVPGLGRNSRRAVSLTTLLNGIASLSQRIILVLDDYHAISNLSVHEDVTVLLEGLPPALHLILSTRVDPPLPIARLRVRGQLSEIRAADLRFTTQETARFLNQKMGLRLSARDVEALESRTEGWVAGLQMAALSMQGYEDPQEFISTFTGGHPHLQEYLAEEVIRRQPVHVREFLIQTSILNQLNGSICSAVSGNAESTRLLSELERNNLFITALDEKHTWYRYHTLFSDSLRQSLEQTVPVERIQELHRRASGWLEEHAMISEAVKHASKAQDFERVAWLAEQAAQTSVLDSRMMSLLGWVDTLPEAVVHAHPRLRVFQAWALVLGGQFGPAWQIIMEVRQFLENLPSGPENDQLRADLAIWLEIIERLFAGFMLGFDGNLDQAIQAHEAAREKAKMAGILSLAAIATEGLALAQYHQGRLHRSARSCREIIELGRRGVAGPLPLAAAGHIELAGIYLEWNDRREVERHLKLGMELGRRAGDATILAEAYLVQSRLYQAAGDLESALEALRPADQVLAASQTAGTYSVTHFYLDVQRIGLYLSAGRLDEALWRLREMEEFASRAEFRPALLAEARRMLWVQLHLAQGRPEQALAVLEELIGPSEAAGRYGHVMKLLVLKALALQMQGETKSALAALGRSLAMAEPEGYIRLYLDEGSPAIVLLRQAAGLSSGRGCVDRLLAAWALETSAAPSPDTLVLIEPLTPTEMKVLHLVAGGCSNREITEQLVIALDTVKRHTNHIYGKLNVKSRTQAIVRARQLGLIHAQPRL